MSKVGQTEWTNTPGLAKLRQTLIAVFALDALVSKETQLLLFINIVGLGGEGGLG